MNLYLFKTGYFIRQYTQDITPVKRRQKPDMYNIVLGILPITPTTVTMLEITAITESNICSFSPYKSI